MNPRGNGLKKTENALRSSRYDELADRIREVRNQKQWPEYVRNLAGTVYEVAEGLGCSDNIRFLLNGKGLKEGDRPALRDLPGIVWLS